MTRYAIDPTRTSVIVHARSTAGQILWEATGATGELTAEVIDGRVEPYGAQGRLELALERLSSGNALYDAELLRRIDARRHPMASVELLGQQRVDDHAFKLEGALTLHGIRRTIEGTVSVSVAGPDELHILGEQTIDIRDFGVPQPTMLMLKIFPDVTVRLFIAAVRHGA